MNDDLYFQIEYLKEIYKHIFTGKNRYPLHIRAVCSVLIEDLIARKTERIKQNEKNQETLFIGRVNF